MENNNKLKTILHIDDDQNILDIIKYLLKGKNYRIISDTLGSNTIKLAEKYEPDIIILDVMMPDMNGYELLPLLRNNPITKDTPILILSVSSTQKKSLALGATIHITKPMDQPKLVKTIQNLIQYKNK